MDKTCKSNADCWVAIFDSWSGERVRNTWAIYRKARDNSEKSELIPDVAPGRHLLGSEAGDSVKAGPGT